MPAESTWAALWQPPGKREGAKMIDITGVDKADVLAALYNASRPQGLGFMQYDPKPMTKEEAEALLAERSRFDYLKGRVIKITFKGEEIDPQWYDLDNGLGAAERAISALRESGQADNIETQAAHAVGKQAAAEYVRKRLDTPTTFDGGVVRFGLADVADKLGPAIDKALGETEGDE